MKKVLKFPAALQAAREEAGLSQQDMADRAGVSQGYISQLETSKLKSPSPGRTDKLVGCVSSHPFAVRALSEAWGRDRVTLSLARITDERVKQAVLRGMLLEAHKLLEGDTE